MTIRSKFFLIFVAISGLPFLIFSSLVLWLNLSETESIFRDTALRSARQAAISLDAVIDPANRAMAIMAASTDTSSLVQKDSTLYVNNLGEWYLDSLRLAQVMRTASGTTPMISHLFLIMEDGLAGFSESDDFLKLSLEASERWQGVMAGTFVDLRWFPPEAFTPSRRRDALTGIARIRDPENLRRTVGYARADIPLSVFTTVLENAETTDNAFTLISDEHGQIITLSERGKSPSALSLRNLRDSLTGDLPQEVLIDGNLGGERFLVFSRKLAAPFWRFTLAIPYSDLSGSFDRARSRSLLIFLAMIPILAPAAWLLARSMSHRIRSLRDRFALVGSRSPSLRREDISDDEIGQLSRRFNEMTLRIDSLLEEEYTLGRRVSELELQVLQAQINPHFLYNTLDMVNCLALSRGDAETAGAVTALARFYRSSLSGGADMVSLKAELEHVRFYVEVENLRFDGGILLSLPSPGELGELSELLLPKLSLQPLVENAIHHGILEKEEAKGSVEISVRREGELVSIEVANDGAGLREEKAAAPRSDHGFGLRNIRERLILAFGESATVTLSAQRGGGVAATIRFRCPAVPVPGRADMRTPWQ